MNPSPDVTPRDEATHVLTGVGGANLVERATNALAAYGCRSGERCEPIRRVDVMPRALTRSWPDCLLCKLPVARCDCDPDAYAHALLAQKGLA